jgi:hypothetical protein
MKILVSFTLEFPFLFVFKYFLIRFLLLFLNECLIFLYIILCFVLPKYILNVLDKL